MDLDSRALRIDSNEILSKALFRSMKMPIEGTFFDKLRCNLLQRWWSAASVDVPVLNPNWESE